MDFDYLLWLQGLRGASHPILQAIFSFLGTNAFFMIILLVPCVVYWCIDKRKGMLAMLAYGMSAVCNQVVKNTVCRYRPWVLDARMQPDPGAVPGATGYSFPSGHSQSTSSLLGSLGWEWRKTKRWVLVVAVVLSLLMGFSRNFLGVHTPQDVVLGLLEGALFIYPAHLLFAWVEAAGDDEPRDLRVLGAVVAVVAVYLAYVTVKPYPMDYEGAQLLVDPAEMLIDCYKTAGSLVGIIAGWVVERRYVRFECEGVSIAEGVCRFLAGAVCLGLAYGLLGHLLSVVLPVTAAQLLKHIAAFFSAVAVAPMTFSWLHERFAKRA